MTHLSNIPGIGKSSLELLEAAGFLDAESLAKAGAGELAIELERANKILQIAKRAPNRANVAKWISSARDLTGGAESAGETVMPVMPVNHEESPQVVSLLAVAPFAIPLPARQLMEKQLAVSDIPAAIFLNRYSGDLEVKVDARIPQAPQGRPAVSSSFVQMADNGPERMQIDSSRLKSTETIAAGSVRTHKSPHTPDEDRVSLIRGPRETTNRGRDPKSRFYIRGVLHSHPLSIAFGALVTLTLALMLPAGIISAGLLLLSAQVPEHFSWVPKWLLAFPLGLPVFGLLYLIFGLGGTCRICGQKQFVPRACLKNSKAHHVRGLGHIVPVCFHILLFRWFRCTYCGTPVRLKK
jgi:hypothetical protein